MAMQSLLLPIVSLFKSQGIASARQALFGLNKDFTNFASNVGRAAGAFAAFQGLASAREFAVQSVETTQRFERNLLALQQVFEEITPQLRSFTREVENYGLSQSRAAQASVFLGSVLKQYGFSTQEAADETERLVKLSQDLATTYGYDVQEALLAVTALFRGEFDPIEKFGVAMKQSEINARLAADGLANLEGEALNYASAQTRLTMLFERAGDSVGAYSRASDTLYVAQQQLAAVTENLQVAFGSSLQQPIAEIINQFTELAQTYGPDVADIGRAIGSAIEGLTPLFKQLSETFFLLLAPLETVVRFLGLLGTIFSAVLSPALMLINGALRDFNTLLNFLAITTDEWVASLGGVEVAGSGVLRWLNDVLDLDKTITFFDGLSNSVRDAFESMEDYVDKTRNNEFTEASRDAAMLRNAIQNTSMATEEAGEQLEPYLINLQNLGLYSKDAEGNLSGLALAFSEIETAAEQSKASEALEDIGFSAAQIEEILTRPDWQQIFGQISELARLTALDMTKLSYAGAVFVSNSIDALETLIAEGFGGLTTGSGAAAKDFVKEFFTGIDEEVEKQTARRQLARMGASEGLIEAILGAGEWEKVFDSIVSSGIAQLNTLQQRFNRTAAGLDELNRLQEESKRVAEEAQEAALEAAEALRRQEEEYANLISRLEEFKSSISGLALGGILSTYESEVGRFEASIISSFEKIQSSLVSALENGNIFQMAFNQLQAFANQEQQALQQIARQRDQLAAKGDWIEGLLREYRQAFQGALSLTNALNAVEERTREVVVTETRRGVLQVGDSLRNLTVQIQRTYTETISETANKTEALVKHFQDITMKARAFAQNLQALKQLGLDPMLFNQLVQAGVEAGGETAQALVDGGADTIGEINSLFQEIGQLGIDVGESVAEDFYATGEGFASALLAGIRSQQAAFEETARQMASAFEQNFGGQVNTAVGQVAEVANLSNQLSAFEQEQQRIANRIAEQEAILTGGTAGPGARAWAEKKLESYLEQLDNVQDAISGTQGAINQIQVTPLASGGIALGAALAMIGEGGPEAVIPLDKLDAMMNQPVSGGDTNITINVTAGNRAGGVAAGEAIITALKSYGLANGPVNSYLGTSQVTL